MEELFYTTVIYSCFAATTFLILTKYRVISYLQAHTESYANRLVNCQLCICFWLCLFFSVIGITFDAGLITLLSPFAGAALTRAIIG